MIGDCSVRRVKLGLIVRMDSSRNHSTNDIDSTEGVAGWQFDVWKGEARNADKRSRIIAKSVLYKLTCKRKSAVIRLT
jgi:hypothetical protein